MKRKEKLIKDREERELIIERFFMRTTNSFNLLRAYYNEIRLDNFVHEQIYYFVKLYINKNTPSEHLKEIISLIPEKNLYFDLIFIRRKFKHPVYAYPNYKQFDYMRKEDSKNGTLKVEIWKNYLIGFRAQLKQIYMDKYMEESTLKNSALTSRHFLNCQKNIIFINSSGSKEALNADPIGELIASFLFPLNKELVKEVCNSKEVILNNPKIHHEQIPKKKKFLFFGRK